MDRVGGGQTPWEHHVRVLHELTFTVSDDALGSVSLPDGEVSVTLQARKGAVTFRLRPNQVRRLIEGDPRNKRFDDVESY